VQIFVAVLDLGAV